MKKSFVLTFSLLLLSCGLHAATLSKGSLKVLKQEHYLAVSLDCSQTTYMKTQSFNQFLSKSKRSESWEQFSLDCFIDRFNKYTSKKGLVGVYNTSRKKGKYELVIRPQNLGKERFMTGVALLINTKTNATVATIRFIVEYDERDKIALRSPMVQAGKEIGKLVKNELKLGKGEDESFILYYGTK